MPGTIDNKAQNTNYKGLPFTCAKANTTIRFLKRNISLVRPTVEYATALWNTHLQKGKQKLEMVQRISARYVKKSVTDMLEQLKRTQLEDRRKYARLTMMYKINN